MAIQFLEKDLENIIYDTPNKKLRERGLLIVGHKKRQLRIGNYGIADLVSFKRSWCSSQGEVLLITVFELKQNKIDANTMMQAIGYCKGIERYISFRKKKLSVQFNIVLVGKTICDGNFCYLTDFFNDMKIYNYSYEYDGIKFNQRGEYSLIEEGFKNG